MAKNKKKSRRVVVVRDKQNKYKLKKLEEGYAEGGLRGNWLEFIDEFMVNGMNATKACMVVFKYKSRNTASNMAARMLSRASVVKEIEARLNSQKITNDAIRNELWEIATTYRGHKTIGVAVNALNTLARIKGMIKEGERGGDFFQNNYLVYSPIVKPEDKDKVEKVIKGSGRLIE